MSFKVSWESIALFGNQNANISASARVFLNGTVELCWGVTANLGAISLLAGVSDPTRSVFAPARGRPFDGSGFFPPLNSGRNNLPTNQCQRFLENLVDRPAPTPTNYPSYDYPSTYYPSYDYPSGQPHFDDGICRDATDTCVTSFGELRSRIASVRYSETIAICGSFSVPSTLSISQSNVTLCCASSLGCTLSANSFVEQRILYVDGDNVSLRFITFRGGVALREDGGNVAIVGRGDHRIVDCVFSDGFSDQFGGNLFVKNADRCHISGSTFQFGNANYGGGAAFEDTVLVNIEDTVFDNNTGQDGGGGVFVSLAELTVCTSVRQVTSFSRVVFAANFADYGAGFLESSIGTMPRLIVEDSLFFLNEANQLGGAGAVFQYNDDLIVRLSNNEGLDNIDKSGQCDDFALYVDATEPGFLCVAAVEDLRLPT